jgi:hypothetical protein
MVAIGARPIGGLAVQPRLGPSARASGGNVRLLDARLSGDDFHRAIRLVAALSAAPGGGGRAAILTNMLDVISRGSAADFERTATLGVQLGVHQVADVHGELDGLLGMGPGVPFTTAAITKLSRTPQIEALVLGVGRPAGVARRTARTCADTAFWLLMVDIDHHVPAPLPGSPEELRLIVERRGADTWRRILANIAANPWGLEGTHLVDLARAADLAGPAQAIERCRTVCRQRIAEAERAAVAREIRRLVAVSCCTQRQFAQYLGTSAPRLSSYVTGSVTPSAAMMLRINRQSSALAQRSRTVV